MVNELPTYPHVLAEASAFSLSDLAIMSPGEMSPEAEVAYIGHLAAQRERYEKALGAKSEAKRAKTAKPTAASLLSVDMSGDVGGAGELF